MASQNWKALSRELDSLLRLKSPALAITFSDAPPAGTHAFEGAMAEPASDGRTGKVPAGCAFWVEATYKTFTTAPEDHGNCSVGSLTHGLKTLEEIANNSDVAALIESGWVNLDAVSHIPVVKQRPNFITYGPLAETAIDPDVVFMRLNAKQVMVLHDALPDLRFEGKPQCHIIPIAKENNEVAVSVGCMLSRVRTAIPNNEMTCAIPAGKLADLVQALKKAAPADAAVAAYASQDAKRFGR